MKRTIAPFLSLAFVCVLVAAPARADVTRAQCAETYERAQYLRRETKLREAREALLVCSQDTCPAVVKSDCVPWLAEVERAMPSIAIALRDSTGKDLVGAEISIDGVVQTSVADGRAVNVDPGPHTIHVRTADGRTADEPVLVRVGEKNRPITIVIAKAVEAAPTPDKPATEPPPAEASRRSMALPIGLAAVGAVGLGSSVFFGVSAKSEADDVRARCAPRCTDGDLDAVRTKLLLSDIGLAVGVVALVAATYFWLSAPSSAKANATKTLNAGARGGTIAITF